MQKTFSDIFEEYLNYHLSDFCGKNLNGVTFAEIQNLVFSKTREIFSRCEFDFSENALKFLSDIYLNDIEINGKKIEHTNPLKKYQIGNGELDMLEQMFFDRDDVMEEIQKTRV